MNFAIFYPKFTDFMKSSKLLEDMNHAHKQIFNEDFEPSVYNLDDSFYLLTLQSAIIGIGAIKKHSPNYHFNENKEHVNPYLLDFGIVREFRQNGLGSMFLREIINAVKKEYPNSKSVNLDVEMNNSAIKFYKKNRFKQCGTYANMYISMTCSI